MDDVESLAMTPHKNDNEESNGEASWMKSILARGDRTTDSNLNVGGQLSDRDTTRLSSGVGATMSSNPLSQLKARIRE